MGGITVTSLSLLQRVQQLDSAAWEKFVRLYSPLVYAVARSTGLQPTDAQDVSQDVFAKLAVVIKGYRHTGSFRGWLATLTRNRMLDTLRARQHRPATPGGTDFQAILNSVAQPVRNDPELSRWLEPSSPKEDPLFLRAITLLESEFARETYKAFWRMEIDGNSAEAVARELGWHDERSPRKGANRVRQAKARVLRRLREEFSELIDQLPPEKSQELTH